MASPSSSSQNTVVSDSTGDQASLTLQPTGSSGITVTANGGSPVATVVANAAGFVIMGGTTGSGTAQVTASGSTVEATIDAKNSLNVEANLTVQPGFLAALTNGGGTGEISVENQIGVVNTVNLNSSPNANFTNQSNNRISYFSGIGQFVDNSATPPQAQGTVNCDVPFPLPAGATAAVIRLEIVLLVKCVVTNSSLGFYRVFPGDYFLQKFYTTWANISGTLSVANSNVGSSPIDGFTGVATLDTSGITFANTAGPTNNGTPNPWYKLATDVVVTPGGGGLLVQATPNQYTAPSPFGLINISAGTSLVQIYVTAYYN